MDRLTIRITRGGQIMFDFRDPGYALPDIDPPVGDVRQQLGAAYQKRFQLINAFVACIYDECAKQYAPWTSKCMISGLNAISGDMEGGGSVMISPDLGTHYMMLSPFASSYNPEVSWSDSRLSWRNNLITIPMIDAAIEKFESIRASTLSDLTAIISLLLRSTVICEAHEFAASLMMSWAPVERLIDVMWKNKYLPANMPLSASRKDSLNDTRTFSAAVRLEILRATKLLDDNLAEKTASVRRARNNWMHGLAPIDERAATAGIDICSEWIKLVSGIELKTYPSVALAM